MAKFKKYDYVKFTEDAIKGFGFDSGSYVITDVIKNEDGEYVYELYRQQMFSEQEIRTEVNEYWLERGKSPKEVLDSALLGIKLPVFSKIDAPEGRCDNCCLKVSILGTTYTIIEKHLKDVDGYCDKTTKEIAVAAKEDDCDLGNFEEYRKKVLRHEITHAYFFESGLAECFENIKWGIPETLVDWFAYQSPKIFKTFEELNIL